MHLFLGSGILYNSVCSVTISVCLSVSWQKKTCSFDVNFLGSQIPRDYVCPYVIKFLYECHKVRVVKIHWFSDPITIVLIPSKHTAQPKSVKANYCSPVRKSTKPASSILLKQIHKMMKIGSTKAYILGYSPFFSKNWIANAAYLLNQVT